MRKLTAIAVLISVGTQVVSAADFTLRPYIGYGFGVAQMAAGSEKTKNTLATIPITKDEAINYSAGAGVKLGLGVDIGINDYLSFEPMIGYSIGREVEVNKYAESGTGYTYGDSNKYTTSFIPFSVTMKIRAKAGKFTPYAGFGPSFAFGAETLDKYAEVGTGSSATNLVNSEEETTYNMGFGYHGVVGTDYNVSGSLVLFFQAKAESMSLHQDTGKFTKYTVDGVNKLASRTTKQKETTYKDDIGGYNGAITTAPNQAKVAPISAGSLAINVGVSYKF